MASEDCVRVVDGKVNAVQMCSKINDTRRDMRRRTEITANHNSWVAATEKLQMLKEITVKMR